MQPDRNRILELWHSDILPEREFRDHLLEGEAIQRRLRVLADHLNRDLSGYNKKIVIAIQDPGTVCRYLELPPLSSKEMETAVPVEACKYIPFPMSEVNLTYFPVAPLAENVKKAGIFFVAAKKDSVESLRNLLEGLGFEVDRIETPALALTRELSHNHDIPRGQSVLLLHIGFAKTRIVVVRDGFPYYVRDFIPAGRDFTYAFQVGLQKTWQEAEKQKLDYDVNLHEPSFEPYLMRLTSEVKKTIAFFNEQLIQVNAPIAKVYMSGGEATMKNLAEYLSQNLGMPVVPDGWDKLQYEGKERYDGNAESYKVAVGLAL